MLIRDQLLKHNTVFKAELCFNDRDILTPISAGKESVSCCLEVCHIRNRDVRTKFDVVIPLGLLLEAESIVVGLGETMDCFTVKCIRIQSSRFVCSLGDKNIWYEHLIIHLRE